MELPQVKLTGLNSAKRAFEEDDSLTSNKRMKISYVGDKEDDGAFMDAVETVNNMREICEAKNPEVVNLFYNDADENWLHPEDSLENKDEGLSLDIWTDLYIEKHTSKEENSSDEDYVDSRAEISEGSTISDTSEKELSDSGSNDKDSSAEMTTEDDDKDGGSSDDYSDDSSQTTALSESDLDGALQRGGGNDSGEPTASTVIGDIPSAAASINLSSSTTATLPPPPPTRNPGPSTQPPSRNVREEEEESIRQYINFFTTDLQNRFCSLCCIKFNNVSSHISHYVHTHPEFNEYIALDNLEPNIGKLNLLHESEALGGQYRQYGINLLEQTIQDITGLFFACRDSIVNIMSEEFKRRRQFKVQFSVDINYAREDVLTGEIERTTDCSIVDLFPIEHKRVIALAMKNAGFQIQESIDVFTKHGSGWYLENISRLEMMLCEWDQFSGGSEWQNSTLPPCLARKNKCFINTVGVDDLEHCFAHSIVCHFEFLKKQNQNEEELTQWLDKNPCNDKKVFNVAVKAKENQLAKKLSHFRLEKLSQGKYMEDRIIKSRDDRGKLKMVYNYSFNNCGLNGNSVDFSDLQWPFDINQIGLFEKKNPLIGLTVIGFDDKEGHVKTAKKKGQDILRNLLGKHNDGNDDFDDDLVGGDDDDIIIDSNGDSMSRKQMEKMVRKHMYPLYTCKEDRPIKIDLLLLMRENGNHFIYIEKIVPLIETKRRNNHNICRYCLNFFGENTYSSHVAHCALLGLQKTNFPNKHPNLEFKNFYRTQRVPFIYIADFEALLVECTSEGLVGASNEGISLNNTVLTHKHLPTGYAWLCLDHRNRPVKIRKFRLDPKNPEHVGIDVAKRFLTEILADAEKRQEEVSDFETEVKLKLQSLPTITEADKQGICYFCKTDLERPVDGKSQKTARHHSHLPPFQFLGFAHNICNSAGSLKTKFPCFVHNLTGYDSQFIIRALDDEIVSETELIALTTEKFMSINLNNSINFVDSLCFFNESLEQLVGNMNIKTDFNITREVFKKIWSENSYSQDWGDERVELLLKKNAYPYSYMSNFDRFKEQQLPSIDHFYNDLSEQDMDPLVYANAQKVWHDLEIKNLGEWHDLYVQTDVTLLADSIVRLREVMLNHFELDIAHYLSLPMFSLDAALKYTGVSLDLLTDPEMYLWVERSIRGGLTSVGDVRMCKANNKYMSEYNPEESSSYLLYIDANNLYGSALSDYLPQGNYKWVNELDLDKIRINPEEYVQGMGDKDSRGMFFEVDLVIEDSEHEKLNAFPPCPYRRTVSKEEVSPNMQDLAETLGVEETTYKSPKLITDLHPKKNYICHYRALKTWLDMGVKITKVHKALSFFQSKWMAPYITFNTNQRKKAAAAKNTIEVKFWKLLNNTGFGKCIENKRGRRNIIVITNSEKARLYNKKPTIQSVKILHENLVLAICKRLSVMLDRPIPVGVACLELSKVIMYKFMYNYIAPKYTDKNGVKRYNLVYTDTDSLVLLIQTDDIYQDCKENEKDYFDMSDYDPSHPVFGEFYGGDNAKRLAMMKDECANGVMTHFIATKPKMYVFICENNVKDKATGQYLRDENGKLLVVRNDNKKAKGIRKPAVKNRLDFNDYYLAATSAYQKVTHFTRISSKNNYLYTLLQHKRAINGVDNKRFFVDSIFSLAFGHYLTYMYL